MCLTPFGYAQPRECDWLGSCSMSCAHSLILVSVYLCDTQGLISLTGLSKQAADSKLPMSFTKAVQWVILPKNNPKETHTAAENTHEMAATTDFWSNWIICLVFSFNLNGPEDLGVFDWKTSVCFIQRDWSFQSSKNEWTATRSHVTKSSTATFLASAGDLLEFAALRAVPPLSPIEFLLPACSGEGCVHPASKRASSSAKDHCKYWAVFIKGRHELSLHFHCSHYQNAATEILLARAVA